eukprot:9826940-Alexandrium_andersonii.AAC.1
MLESRLRCIAAARRLEIRARRAPRAARGRSGGTGRPGPPRAPWNPTLKRVGGRGGPIVSHSAAPSAAE